MFVCLCVCVSQKGVSRPVSFLPLSFRELSFRESKMKWPLHFAFHPIYTFTLVFCELSSSSAVSEVGDRLWSSGRQRLPAAAPGVNSRGQQWHRSLQDHIYSSYQHNALIGNHISTRFIFFSETFTFLKSVSLWFSYLYRSFLAGSSCSTSTITFL